MIKKTMELQARMKPLRASGTRWIAHKVSAMKRIVDKYVVYVQHLEHISSDTSYRAKERPKYRDT